MLVLHIKNNKPMIETLKQNNKIEKVTETPSIICKFNQTENFF